MAGLDQSLLLISITHWRDDAFNHSELTYSKKSEAFFNFLSVNSYRDSEEEEDRNVTLPPRGNVCVSTANRTANIKGGCKITKTWQGGSNIYIYLHTQLALSSTLFPMVCICGHIFQHQSLNDGFECKVTESGKPAAVPELVQPVKDIQPFPFILPACLAGTQIFTKVLCSKLL